MHSNDYHRAIVDPPSQSSLIEDAPLESWIFRFKLEHIRASLIPIKFNSSLEVKVLATKTVMKVLLASLILLGVIHQAAWNPASPLISGRIPSLISSQVSGAISSLEVPLSTPGPDLAITNWTHNHIENPGLESWSSPVYPSMWATYRTNNRYFWIATEPPFNVSEGTYSAAQQTRSGTSTTGWSYYYQTALAADMQNLTLSFDWLVALMPDQNYDNFMVYARFSDNRYLYYYIAGANLLTPTNSSINGYYQSFGALNVWNHFYRNITADYLAIPGFPGTIAPALTISSVYFYLTAGAATHEWVRAFFDDVQLQDETVTYIGGTTRNGNLETGNFGSWANPASSEESYVSRSSTAHTGAFSGNLTAVSTGNMSLGQLYQFPRTRITSTNPGSFGVWWQLNQANVGYADYAVISFQFYNFTHYFRVWYILGCGGISVFSNTTVDHYLFIDGFNTTGSWQYLQRNLWQDMTSEFGSSDAVIDHMFFHVRANNPNSRVELLVDDLRLVTGAVNGADFEDQRDPGAPIYGWSNTYSPGVTVTDQGYGGGKAANCSILPFGSIHLEQPLHSRPLNGTRETYLDLMWRIEDFSEGEIMFHVRFDDNRILWYVLSTSNWGSLTNNTDIYFNVTGSGSIGSWIQLHRDLVHDYEAAFASLPNVDMIELDFYADAGNAPLEVLFDDLYLYDDPAPLLSNPSHAPSPPDHNQAVQVDVDIVEQDLDIAYLIYRVNSGSFNFLMMTHHTGNTYRATIPGEPYNTIVEYFLQVNDTWGMTSTLQNGITYFSYTVDDLSDPELSITAPSMGEEVSGIVDIDVTATDEASGMDRVEFALDGNVMNTDSSAPYSYAWDSTTVTDGDYSITITAYDNEGNDAVASISVTVNNAGTPTPPPPPIPGFPFEAIVIGLVASIGGIFVIRRRLRQA